MKAIPITAFGDPAGVLAVADVPVLAAVRLFDLLLITGRDFRKIHSEPRRHGRG